MGKAFTENFVFNCRNGSNRVIPGIELQCSRLNARTSAFGGFYKVLAKTKFLKTGYAKQHFDVYLAFYFVLSLKCMLHLNLLRKRLKDAYDMPTP